MAEEATRKFPEMAVKTLAHFLDWTKTYTLTSQLNQELWP